MDTVGKGRILHPPWGSKNAGRRYLHILLRNMGSLDRNSRSHSLRYLDSQENLIPRPSGTGKDFKKQKDVISKVWNIIGTFAFLLLFCSRIFHNAELFYHIGCNNTGIHAADDHLVYPMRNVNAPVSCWASSAPFPSK